MIEFFEKMGPNKCVSKFKIEAPTYGKFYQDSLS